VPAQPDGLLDRDRRNLAAIGKLRFSPLAVTSGAGRHLIDERGRRLLDLSAGWGAASLGYGHPELVDAVSRSARGMAGAGSLSVPNESAVALAEELLAALPGDRDRRVWLGHSGSDATETAIKALQAASGRSRVVSFVGGYHGGTSGSMAVSAHSPFGHTQLGAGNFALPFPNPYRPMLPGDPAESVLSYLDELLATICPPEQLAAVIVEPLQSDGGMIDPPTGVLAGLAERCARHDVPLVCDEVKVGIGRTGVMPACREDGVTPDVLLLGKGLGGGLPLSAVLGPREVMDFAHGFAMQTTIANPVCAEAGRAVLRVIERERLAENARRLGETLRAGLAELGSRHEGIGDVRGRGLAIGVELVSDRETREPAVGLAAMVSYRAFELGLVLFYVGLHSNVLELTPPLTLTDDEAAAAIEILDRALADAAAGRVSEQAVAEFAGW
jgi:4-aminobutyrate aminotransferase